MPDPANPAPGTEALARAPVPASPLDMDLDHPVEEISGLCLSGGGYRAMLFHVGALYRMNQLGLLSTLARISSVSGGSMTAGALAAAWPRLTWQNGRATNLDGEFLAPLLAQANDSIDISSALSRFNPFTSPAAAAARSYDTNFAHGLRLSQLVKSPLFVFNATSLITGKAVRFRHDYVADWTVGVIEGLPVTLAQAVAASAAFPPVLSPAIVQLAGGRIRAGTQGSNASLAQLGHAVLTDGGVYDNMGTETVWKRCRTVFVSNAGRPFDVDDDPPSDLLQQTMRVIDIISAQSEDLRERILAHAYACGTRKGATWGLATGLNDPAARPPLLTPAEYDAAKAVDTRLQAMPRNTQALLMKAGYAHAAARLRQYFGTGAGGPPDVPDGDWPTR